MHPADEQVNLLVIGTAQDGGYPHTGCSDACCQEAWRDETQKRLISSLAILSGRECFLIDITPDFKYQYRLIKNYVKEAPRISGIFITHAHSGHYTGLLDLGLEVMNTYAIPVYAMGKMKSFLEEKWQQLLSEDLFLPDCEQLLESSKFQIADCNNIFNDS